MSNKSTLRDATFVKLTKLNPSWQTEAYKQMFDFIFDELGGNLEPNKSGKLSYNATLDAIASAPMTWLPKLIQVATLEAVNKKVFRDGKMLEALANLLPERERGNIGMYYAGKEQLQQQLSESKEHIEKNRQLLFDAEKEIFERTKELSTAKAEVEALRVEYESRACWIREMNLILGYNNDDGFHSIPSPHDLAKRLVEDMADEPPTPPAPPNEPPPDPPPEGTRSTGSAPPAR